MTKFLSSLKFWQKIVLVLGAFILPIGVLAFFTFGAFQDHLALVHLEQHGNAFARPVAELMQHIDDHMNLAERHQAGQKQTDSAMSALQAEIEKSLDTLDQLHVRWGKELQYTQEGLAHHGRGDLLPATIRADWRKLKSSWQTLTPAQSEQEHEALIHRVQGILGHIAEASDLALDPALDSFNMMDAAFNAMPFIQDRFNGIVDHALRSHDGDATAVTALAVQVAMLRDSDFARLERGIATALREDPDYFGRCESLQREMPPQLATFKRETETLLALATRYGGGDKTVSPEALNEAGERAEEAGFHFWKSAMNELDVLLQIREEHWKSRRLHAALIAFGALALAGMLAWFVIRNVTGPLRQLTTAAQAMATDGDLSHEIEVVGNDEVAQLSRAFAGMTRTLRGVASVAEQIAGGDLRVEVTPLSPRDAMGNSLVKMVASLSTLASHVQKAAVVINSSVTEIAATSKQQQATTSEVAATTTEIGATSKELVKTVNEVTGVAEETAVLAGNGQQSISRMEETMGLFIEAVGVINSKLAVLNEKAGNINQVVTTITKVADQTNLLSLNAAIEAEKAGEYGRGFAVVATEIRRLADQTAVATFDIEQMVKEMQSAVAAGVMGMDKFGEQVRRGVQEVQQVSGQLAQIITQVQALSPRFVTVNEGMQAQATGANQITQALSQLGEATQQTADSLRQSSVSIDQLHDASRGMLSSLDGFKLRAA